MRGEKFNRWTIIDDTIVEISRNKCVMCRCDCGTERYVRLNSLIKGISTSCGCVTRERNKKRLTKHGLTGSFGFSLWALQNKRCNNKKDPSYKNYGGRGIKCVWTPEECVEWVRNNPKPDGDYQIDRINNDGNYEIENVRWATPRENCLNRRTCKPKEYYSVTPTERGQFKEVCRNRGWNFGDFIEIFHSKKEKRNKKYTYTEGGI